MASTADQAITRAKELLATARHGSMATVNADGSPHNSPLFIAFSPDLTTIYWGSHPDSLHSKNALRTGQVFVVMFDAIERGGLYLRGTDARQLEGQELQTGLTAYNIARAKCGRSLVEPSYYSTESPQRMYAATIDGYWVSQSQRTPEGLVIKDYRHQITRDDLVST